jgi:hypothetical protein
MQVLTEGKYSTQPLHWFLGDSSESQCRLTIELQPGTSAGFLRPCEKVDRRGRTLLLIENCPSDWADGDVAKKCNAYAFYSAWKSSVSSVKHPSMTDMAQNELDSDEVD